MSARLEIVKFQLDYSLHVPNILSDVTQNGGKRAGRASANQMLCKTTQALGFAVRVSC